MRRELEAFRAKAAPTRRKRRRLLWERRLFPCRLSSGADCSRYGLAVKDKSKRQGRKSAKIARHADYRSAGSAWRYVSTPKRKSAYHVAQFVGINYREPARARYLALHHAPCTKDCVRLRVKGRKNKRGLRRDVTYAIP